MSIVAMNSDRFNYWMVWVAAGIAVTTAVGVLSGILFMNDTLCTGARDEQCLREWASALGGWAALLVGAPTLMFLAAQVRQADRFQRQNASNAVRKTRAIAFKAKRAAILAGFASTKFEEALIKTHYSCAAAALALKTLRRLLDDSAFRDLENEIGLPERLHLDHVILRLDRAIVIYDQRPDDEPASNYGWAASTHSMVVDYVAGCLHEAKGHIAETNGMIAAP